MSPSNLRQAEAHNAESDEAVDNGALAEEVGHHPAILTEWGKVNVRWWSHEIGGLHKSDFIMAAKTDLIII